MATHGEYIYFTSHNAVLRFGADAQLMPVAGRVGVAGATGSGGLATNATLLFRTRNDQAQCGLKFSPSGNGDLYILVGGNNGIGRVTDGITEIGATGK